MYREIAHVHYFQNMYVRLSELEDSGIEIYVWMAGVTIVLIPTQLYYLMRFEVITDDQRLGVFLN